MTFPWSGIGPHRKPLAVSWCGNYASGLRIGAPVEAQAAQFYPKHGSPRDWQTGAAMPVRWDNDATGKWPYASSDFTGEMHAYAQALMGHPRAVELFEPGGQGFRADWAYTHGLYVQTLADGSIQLWCIAVSSAGVYARKALHCKVPAGYTAPAPPGAGATVEELQKWDAEKFKELRGYYPHAPGSDMQWFDTSSNWTQLADSAAMTPFYSKSAIYSRCGWCFNSDGSEAVNTCYEYEYDGSRQGYHTYEYVLTITPDGNGEPVSAALTLNSDGYALYNWPFASPAPARLVVPTESGCLQKWDFSLDGSSIPLFDAPGEIAPLVSWYDETDNIDGLVHHNKNPTTSGYFDTSVGDTDPLPVGTHQEDVGNRNTGVSGGVCFRGDLPGTYESKDGETRYYYTNPVSKHAWWKTFYQYVYPSENVFVVQNERFQWYTFNDDGFYVGIVPLGDRRSAYYYWMTDSHQFYVHSRPNEGDQYKPVALPPGNSPYASDYGPGRYKLTNGPTLSTRKFRVDGDLYPCNTMAYREWSGRWNETLPARTKTFHGTLIPAGMTESTYGSRAYMLVEQLDCDTNYVWNTKNVWGRPESGAFGDPIVWQTYAPGPISETIDTKQRADHLEFRRPGFGVVTLFDRSETYDGVSWKTIFRPEEGNKYAYQNENYQKMLTWADDVSQQVVYSTEMDGIDGSKLQSVLTLTYPISTLPSAVTHGWIGVPGTP